MALVLSLAGKSWAGQRRRPRAATALVAVGVVSVVLTACGAGSSASPTTTARRATSGAEGWKTYVYERAAISVPASWKVVTADGCPGSRAPGTLFLGRSQQPGTPCPQHSATRDSVSLTAIPPGADLAPLASCPPIRVHGLLVEVGPCGSGNPWGLTWWLIPGLGVRADATGVEGSSVGRGTPSVVGRVLRTLRQATAKEVIDSSPVDWPTYTYRAAAISVPSSWAVRRDQNCPDTAAEGTLELGLPEVLTGCTRILGSPARVTVSTLTPDESSGTSCPRFEVNRLQVYVADCGTGSPVGVTSWTIPSLGVKVSGSALGSLQATALVNLILHTVRRATPKDVANATPLSLRIALEHTRVAAGQPIRGTAVFTNRSGASILVEACAADGWLSVGLANHRVPYNPVSPLIACAPSVRLAPGVTRLPITVMTTYQACSGSGPKSDLFPRCNHGNQLPPLPPGTYHTVVVTSGLPPGTPVPDAVRVTLTRGGLR